MRTRLPAILLTLLAALAWNGALAQVQLPAPLPQLPQLPLPGASGVLGAAGSDLQAAAREVRELRVRRLMQRFPRDLERDPRGAPVMRSVILALSPTPTALQAAQAAGFTVQSDEELPALSERVVTLLAPRGLSTRRALNQLRRRDPSGQYDFSHLYAESGEAARDAATGAAAAPAQAPTPTSTMVNARIGLVDSGLRRDHPALRANGIATYGCSGRAVPATHGTAVASLLVGRDGQFQGAAPGAMLFAADVWCGDDAPGGRVEDVARSLAWLTEQQVSVINLSLVGPPNVLLEALVKRVQARGILLVAAAGNDGPSAPPLYPAAYSGVIAVTAVDARQKVLLEAARGKHVRFAAPGADMLAAALTPDYAPVRGTSFAAPLVAGLLAAHIAAGAPPAAALDALVHEARDLGRKGRDDTYGEGLVAAGLARPLATAAIK